MNEMKKVWDNEPTVQNFLKTRRNVDTQGYVIEILDVLSGNSDSSTPGWIQSKNLQKSLVPDKIPNTSTFFKLLADMGSYGLIEKRSLKTEFAQKGKLPVFYRLNIDNYKISNLLYYDDDELREIIKVLFICYRKSLIYQAILEYTLKHAQEHIAGLSVPGITEYLKEKFINDDDGGIYMEILKKEKQSLANIKPDIYQLLCNFFPTKEFAIEYIKGFAEAEKELGKFIGYDILLGPDYDLLNLEDESSNTGNQFE